MNTRRSGFALLALLLPLMAAVLLLAPFAGSPRVHATPAGLVVTNLNDNGTGSLRQTIADAVTGDSITFGVSGTINLTTGLVIDKNLAIMSTMPITISGGGAIRVFEVSGGKVVTFDDLTIAGGNATATPSGPAKIGGGILNAGTLTVNNSTLSGNNADDWGGAIYNYINGTLTMTNSTLSGNTADRGGGIYNQGTLTVNNSTLSDNSAAGRGGGIDNALGTLTVSNSTIHSNRAASSGGGISSNGSSGVSTILKNSIVSGNVKSGTATADDLAIYVGVSDSFTSLGHNLIGQIGPSITAFNATGDRTGINDAKLEPLADNGGPTLTHALLFDSPVRDKGDCSSGPATDQRGEPRPQNLLCDIGAYEFICSPTAVVVNTHSSGKGSLRRAIGDACFDGLVTFDAALSGDTIDLSGGGSITGELKIDTSITISGTVPITISGGNAGRVFNITGGDVTLRNLSIANGAAAGTDDGGALLIQNDSARVTVIDSTISASSAERGGGIHNAGTLTLTRSILSANSARFLGGGIDNVGALVISNSLLSGNSAPGNSGGGIVNRSLFMTATMTVVNSTLSGNKAANNGGGIYNSSLLTVTNSTLSGNSAGYGGGISNSGSGGEIVELTMINSTLSGNLAQVGGGIYNHRQVHVSSSTFSGNRATVRGGGIAGWGYANASATLSNSIVSGNIISGTTTADDIALDGGTTNSFTSGGHNLIGAIGPNITFSGTGDQTGVTIPMLNPLADNGGPTLTHAVQPGSPAIDAGECSGGPATDQRGVPRPQNDRCTIGAYEAFVCRASAVALNTHSSGAGSLRRAISSVCDGGLVTFDAALSGATIDLSTNGIITGELTLDKSISISSDVPINISGGNASRVFYITGGDVTLHSLSISGGKASYGGGIVYQGSGTLVVSSSTLSGNSADDGGGIYSEGAVVISSSTLSGNSADSGGGIVYQGNGTMVISSSTLSGNSARDGGGILNKGEMVISSSTLSGNSAGDGGGIFNYGDVNLSHSTISSNRITGIGGGITSYGGGFDSISLTNSIVAGNIISGTAAPDDLALINSTNSFTSGGHNVIGIGVFFNGTGDVNGVTNPMLEPLADNGGPTLTHALQPGSPAIDQGSCPLAATDQRGFTRPVDLPGINNADDGCDIGAYEFGATPSYRLYLPVILRQ